MSVSHALSMLVLGADKNTRDQQKRHSGVVEDDDLKNYLLNSWPWD